MSIRSHGRVLGLAGMIALVFLSSCAPAEIVITPTILIVPATMQIPTFTPAPTGTRTPTPFPSQTLPPTPTSFVLTPINTNGPFVIGHSVAGRSIVVYRFGSGPVERMIVAGIHGGNEWNTTALANEMITHIREHPEVIPAEITLYILPLLNPDGEARGHNTSGRVNENGVDLNRNWDANWQAEWPIDGCWQYEPVSAGAAPFSEPESRALRDFALEHQISALISYHSAALGIFPAGSPPYPDSVRFAEAVSEVSTYSYPPMDTGCLYTGSLVDWMATLGMAALDIELTNHTNTDFNMNLRIMDVLMHWQ